MIRRATTDDAYTLARLRQAMAEEMRPDAPRDQSFVERTFVYWYEMLEREQACSWLAEVERRPIGMASLLFHRHPPRPWDERNRGYVTGVYVVPEQRRQGYGRALMEAVIAYGREQKLQRLELRTSPGGRPLYAALGFRPQEVLMLPLDEGLSG